MATTPRSLISAMQMTRQVACTSPTAPNPAARRDVLVRAQRPAASAATR